MKPSTSRADNQDGFPLIVIVADGWPRAIFQKCLSDSLLPEISELLQMGTFFPDVVSVFPSVSFACHTTMLTGVNQHLHGIPSHRWMFKDTGRTRDYIGSGVRMVNSDISTRVTTLFERYSTLPTYSIQGIINRGASRSIRFLTMNSRSILSRTADLVTMHPHSVAVILLPKGDGLSHMYGPDSEMLVNEMINTSRGVGILLEKLEKSGNLSRARILFTSDHGQKAVRHSINLASIFHRMGYTARVNPESSGRLDVSVLTSGDSAAYIYFNTSMFPQKARYELASVLTAEEGIDLVFFRFDRDHHRIVSKDGAASIHVLDDNLVRYSLVSGQDPLGILTAAREADIAIGTINPSIHQERFPDIIHQYLTSYVDGRSADVLVTAGVGHHFSKAPRIAWRLGYHRGSHGGSSPEEMLFSAIAVGPGIDRGGVSAPVRSKDLGETVF